MLHTLKRVIGRGTIRLGIIRPFVWLYSSLVTEVRPGQANGREVPTVLALNPDRFRGDLEILAEGGELRILALPFRWQTRLLSLFWPKSGFDRQRYWESHDPEIRLVQERLRAFLRRFLRLLYDRFDVAAVISPALHYVADYDWGIASQQIGVPYIVLHRENTFPSSPVMADVYRERCHALKPFQGEHVVVHNQAARSLLVDAGLAPTDQVHSLGCLRMDDYVVAAAERADAIRAANGSVAPRVVLFSFSPQSGVPNVAHFSPPDAGPGFHVLFNEVHAAIGELARDHPEVEFVIKLKYAGRWESAVRQALETRGLSLESLPNIKVTASADPHELMLSSRVVVGFGSTTLFEAGIAGGAVILPVFAEATDPAYEPYIRFSEENENFDVATSGEDLKSLVLQRLSSPAVDPAALERRRAAFERWVSSLGVSARERYTRLILTSLEPHARRASKS